MSEQEFHLDGSTKMKKGCLTCFIFFFFLTEHINSSVDDTQLERNHLPVGCFALDPLGHAEAR